MEGEPRLLVWSPEDLARVENGCCFARGIFVDGVGGFNILGTENVVKWMAIKGDVDDWSLYYQNPSEGFLARDWDYIRDYGDKMHHPLWIMQLVPSTAEMMQLYRH